MSEIQEGALTFRFSEQVTAKKYDDWAFYRNQFQNGCACDNKAIDMACYAVHDAWLIEVKDYRHHARTKLIELADEMAIKVRDTLAGLVAAQFQANDDDEKQFARRLLRMRTLRVVCHVEQPTKISRLRPRAVEPDKLQDKLRRVLKAIDPHPRVMDAATVPSALPWTVN